MPKLTFGHLVKQNFSFRFTLSSKRYDFSASEIKIRKKFNLKLSKLEKNCIDIVFLNYNHSENENFQFFYAKNIEKLE